MSESPVGNPFRLLGLLLSPWKGKGTVSWLHSLAANGNIDWRQLLYLANLHLCTPLWWVRLWQDRLLDILPVDLQEYLGNLYRLNLERNRESARLLGEFLGACRERGIDVLLLKGAASFGDDLYGKAGARVMKDVDLLVKDFRVEAAKEVLAGLGYQAVPAPGIAFEGLPTDARHHHLPPFAKPGSSLVIELHFRVAYGQAGRALPVDTSWRDKKEASLGGHTVFLLNPTQRLLHNAVHALSPHGEFIRSAVSLLDMAEFAHLAQKYEGAVDWRKWLAMGDEAGLRIPLLGYLETMHQVMRIPWPYGVQKAFRARLHAARIIAAGGHLVVYPGIIRSRRLQVVRRIVMILCKVFYYANLPLWVWRNVCYAPGKRNLPLRIRYFFRKGLSGRSRAKAAF